MLNTSLISLMNKIIFFPDYGRVTTTVWMHHLDVNETYEKKTRWKLHMNVKNCSKHIFKATLDKIRSCTATFLPSHKPFK